MTWDEEDFREGTVKGLMSMGHTRTDALRIFEQSGIIEGFRLNPDFYMEPCEKLCWAEDAMKWYNVRKELGVLAL